MSLLYHLILLYLGERFSFLKLDPQLQRVLKQALRQLLQFHLYVLQQIKLQTQLQFDLKAQFQSPLKDSQAIFLDLQ